jgi:hypothetical protein
MQYAHLDIFVCAACHQQRAVTADVHGQGWQLVAVQAQEELQAAVHSGMQKVHSLANVISLRHFKCLSMLYFWHTMQKQTGS